MDTTDYIDVFIRPEPGSAVRYNAVFYSCVDLFREEGGETPDTAFAFKQALRDRGYRVSQNGRRKSGIRPPKMIRDAAWADPVFAVEAEASRILAETNRSCATH